MFVFNQPTHILSWPPCTLACQFLSEDHIQFQRHCRLRPVFLLNDTNMTAWVMITSITGVRALGANGTRSEDGNDSSDVCPWLRYPRRLTLVGSHGKPLIYSTLKLHNFFAISFTLAHNHGTVKFLFISFVFFSMSTCSLCSVTTKRSI